jgi:osmotically-inducible protein OsmY
MPKPTSYDEITRRTVVEPDGSFRPTPEQVRQSREGFRAMDADENQLSERIRHVLAAGGVELAHVGFEVDRNQVTIRGEVPNGAALARISELISQLDGVDELVDQIVIAAP